MEWRDDSHTSSGWHSTNVRLSSLTSLVRTDSRPENESECGCPSQRLIWQPNPPANHPSEIVQQSSPVTAPAGKGRPARIAEWSQGAHTGTSATMIIKPAGRDDTQLSTSEHSGS